MQYILLAILLFIGVIESIRHRKLTVAGGMGGGIIGFLIFIGAGWTGIAFLATFFLFGTLATSWKRQQKSKVGMAQERGGQRNLGQVIANSGAAGMLGLIALFLPHQKDALALLMAGAFSAATADTLSSELGTIYGKNFYNIITFRKDQKGRDGVVSLEGTLIGIFGSVLIAGLYTLGFGWSEHFLWIVLAGSIGNLVDSILGATLEQEKIIGNNLVNFLNTIAGATVLFLFTL